MRKKIQISKCEWNKNFNIGEEANLQQQSFVWNVFWRISSMKMVNLWCIYRDAICRLATILWVLHWNCASKEIRRGQGMSMWRSGHLVSTALRVNKNVGIPIFVIISYSSPFFLFQKDHFPWWEAPKCMAWSATWESGIWSSWVRRFDNVVGRFSARLCLKNTEAVAWLWWCMIRLYK